jgi:hypothetical protein
MDLQRLLFMAQTFFPPVGLSNDRASWGFSVEEIFARQAILGSIKVSLVWGLEPLVLKMLHGLDVDIGIWAAQDYFSNLRCTTICKFLSIL